MRGDRPRRDVYRRAWIRFTPHARGSTCGSRTIRLRSQVYPACAGIDPVWHMGKGTSSSLPRMRGDRPFLDRPKQEQTSFTPHARGSTLYFSPDEMQPRVYPACAGIDRCLGCARSRWRSLPRMRGDRPIPSTCRAWLPTFTPHARGSTGHPGCCCSWPAVYPACAGIDRACRRWVSLLRSLPRMRGDRPVTTIGVGFVGLFTPHARGSTS